MEKNKPEFFDICKDHAFFYINFQAKDKREDPEEYYKLIYGILISEFTNVILQKIIN